MHLTEAAGKVFAEATAGNIGRRLAIVLNGRVIGAPRVMSAIADGRVQITGNFIEDEIQQMLDALNK